MIKVTYKITILTFILMLIVLPISVHADIGPKPTAKIEVYYNGNPITDNLFNAKMLSCMDIKERGIPVYDLIPQLNITEYDSEKNCYWKVEPLTGRGDCTNSQCQFGYMLPDTFKLAFYIPSLNKTFITNEISRPNFNSNYRVDLNSDGTAIIVDTTPIIKQDKIIWFIKAFILTIIIELLTALIFISITKISKKLLVSVLLANIISLPIVWFIFPLIKNILLVFILSEIFAVIFEAYFIYYLSKDKITLKKSFILSLIMNVASVVIGVFILGVLAIFGF